MHPKLYKFGIGTGIIYGCVALDKKPIVYEDLLKKLGDDDLWVICMTDEVLYRLSYNI